MRRNRQDWCYVCAAAPFQKCAGDEGNGPLVSWTHRVPRVHERWLQLFHAFETDDDRLTKPDGVSPKNWAEIVTEALVAGTQWDAWENGSPGWENFLATDESPDEGPVFGESRPVGREEFLADLDVAVPITGRSGNKGKVLRAMASFGRDDGGNIYPAHATIADRAGVSRDTVKRVLPWAVEAGWLVETRRMGRDVAVWQLASPLVERVEIAA